MNDHVPCGWAHDELDRCPWVTDWEEMNEKEDARDKANAMVDSGETLVTSESFPPDKETE